MDLQNFSTYPTSGLLAAPNGIKYNNLFYAAQGDNVPLGLSWTEGSQDDKANFRASAGTLSGSNGSFNLTMPAENVNIECINKKVVPYDSKGNAQAAVGAQILYPDATEWRAGWYAATGKVTIDSRVTVTGDVNLILCDGAGLTVPKGITVSDGNSLHIWRQQNNTGKLTVTSPEKNYSGIGGGYNQDTGKITIEGGVINVKATYDAAGIGGGYAGSAGKIIINGGDITAQGGGLSAAIGSGGGYGSGGEVTVNGGKITAIGGTGGTITITGGVVNAESGSNAVAIGHGNNSSDNGTLNLGNNSAHYKIATVSSDNKLNYVDSSKRMSACQNSGKIYAEICNNNEYANGVCKYCGVDGPVHSVKVQAENGTVTVSKSSPRTSETVTLTLAPNSGYKLNSLTVTDEKGKAVAVNNNQFIMPDSNVTVKASFVFAPYIKGDANGDGVVNISDVTEIQRLLAKAKTDPDGMITLRANVTGGKLNIDDATAIQRYIAGYSKNPYHIGEKVEK